MKEIVKLCEDVWFNPKYIVNIIFLNNSKNNYQVTYDSTHNNGFVIHRPRNSDMRFVIHTNVLYYYRTKRQELSLVETVEYNNKVYSKKNPHNYRMVRQIYSRFSHPSIHD